MTLHGVSSTRNTFESCIMYNHHFMFPQGNFDEMMIRYKLLLTYIKSAVTRNYSEKSINSILDYISTSKQVYAMYRVFFFYDTSSCRRNFIDINLRFFCKL